MPKPPKKPHDPTAREDRLLQLATSEFIEEFDELVNTVDVLPFPTFTAPLTSPQAPNGVSGHDEVLAWEIYQQEEESLKEIIKHRTDIVIPRSKTSEGRSVEDYLMQISIFAAHYSIYGNLAKAFTASELGEEMDTKSDRMAKSMALSKAPEVRHVINQLFKKRTIAQDARIDSVVGEIFDLGEVTAGDFLHWVDGKVSIKDIDSLTTTQLKAIKEIQVSPNGMVKLSLIDRNKLQDKQLEILKVVQRANVHVNINSENLTIAQVLTNRLEGRESLTSFAKKGPQEAIIEGKVQLVDTPLMAQGETNFDIDTPSGTPSKKFEPRGI